MHTWAKGKGGNLILVIPRDDFAVLMDAIAQIEQRLELFNGIVSNELVDNLSRIASDLSQQADAQ